MPPEAIGPLLVKQTPHEAAEIRWYIESQAHARVTHLEKVQTEMLPDRKLNAWDVRTKKDRYWVITTPTNLYSQELFPSVDYTISFHIGLTLRIGMRRQNTANEEQHDRPAVPVATLDASRRGGSTGPTKLRRFRRSACGAASACSRWSARSQRTQ